MSSRKRIKLVLTVALVISLLALLGVSLNIGRTATANPLKAKLLRRHDKTKLKLTAQDLDSLRSQAPPKEERLFENMIPKHVPLGIRIRKEKEKPVKDLDNERWARDFELEVTNTGEKPIYEFYLLLITDIKAAAGFRIVAPLYYGRTELGTISTLASIDDIPLKPGESTILTIHPGQLDAWDQMRKKEGRPHPKRIQLFLEGLSFGDGTGFAGHDGVALPRKLSEESRLNRCLPQQNNRRLIAFEQLDPGPLRRSSSSLVENLPASFLPVNFLRTDHSQVTSSIADAEPNDCCPGANCTPLVPHREHPCVNCPEQQRPSPTYCADPAGSCFAPVYDSIECYVPKNPDPYLCQTD